MRIKRIHHLTLAVRDLDGARMTFQQLFGLPPVRQGEIRAFGVRTIDMPLGDGILQLASAIESDNPVMRFLERKGEGFYNVAVEVDDLDGAVAELASQGVRVSEPVESEPGVRSSFVTMTATHGISVQLIEVMAAEAWQPPVSAAEQAVAPAPSVVAGASASTAETTSAAKDNFTREGETEEPGKPPLLDLTPDEWSDLD